MFNKGQLAGLMKQAQAMQDNLKKAQDELAHIEVEGQSGSGLVKVLMTCKHEVRRITIDPSLLADDKDMRPFYRAGLARQKCVLSDRNSRTLALQSRPTGLPAWG
ncbi:MAG: YbaB/EbfC family nucleoid-associated protein, partial [Limnohabitans sp.]